MVESWLIRELVVSGLVAVGAYMLIGCGYTEAGAALLGSIAAYVLKNHRK